MDASSWGVNKSYSERGQSGIQSVLANVKNRRCSDGATTDLHKAGTETSWVEVTHPLPDAMNALAECVVEAAEELPGATIGISKEGTLLLNDRAWDLCGPALEELPNLRTTRTRGEDVQVLRFLLRASD